MDLRKKNDNKDQSLTTNALAMVRESDRSVLSRSVCSKGNFKCGGKLVSEDAYKAAAEPKELIIIPKAVHVDLYDKVDIIPFKKLQEFFEVNLNVESTKKTATVEESR